jgi:L-lactate dehydrogenase complex protein LldG
VSSARDTILGRIRTALSSSPAPAEPATYRRVTATPGDPDLFAGRVADYRALVYRCAEADVAATIARALAGRGHEQPDRRLVVPDGLPAAWTAGLTTIPAHEMSIADLDTITVLTGCAVAIAETGTVVLDHSAGQGARVLTLVPDHHIVVVRREQIVGRVADAITELDPVRPQTWISGPSATSDIELVRVEGVHGPRHLDVVIAGK